ncbi:MAG: GMP synthase, partial [Planctomycetes bacterium SM23_32]
MSAAEAATPREGVVVLDFGSQYNQLIARRVRQLGVYCQILPHNAPVGELAARKPEAVILSGGPASVLDPDAPWLDERVLELGVPVLGICYGMQLLAAMLGGRVQKAEAREYGPALVSVDEEAGLFVGCSRELSVWMSHGDQVERLPGGFR